MTTGQRNVNRPDAHVRKSHSAAQELVWAPAVAPAAHSVTTAVREEVPRWVQSLWLLVDVGLLLIVLYAYAGN